MTPKHETTTEYEDDGQTIVIPASLLITTMSYHEQLGTVKKEREKKHLTSSKTFLSDVISCLEPISKKQAREVIITIVADKYYEPRLVTHKYLVERREVSNNRR